MRVALGVFLAALLVGPDVAAGGSNIRDLVRQTGQNLRENFQVDRSQIQAYASGDSLSPGESRQGVFHFLVRPPRASEPTYAYRVDQAPAETDGVRLVVRLLENGGGQEGPRVATGVFEAGKADYNAARALVVDAEKAAADWDTHKEFIEEAFVPGWAAAHEGWRKIAVDLERAREKHPGHLGILKDLIVAYSQLNAFERHTVRGANLCSLIPRRIAEYKERAGPIDGDESREFHKAMALFYFQGAVYPLAMAELAPVSDDPEAAVLKQAMETIGQAGFSNQQSFEVRAARVVYTVAVYQASQSGPPDADMPFHHWYFVPTLRSATSPSSVCYSLVSHKLTKARRYYLYGHTAGRRKLLMIYGTTMPTLEILEAKVRELMTTALATASDRWLSGRGLLAVGLGAVLVVAIALWLVFKRRRSMAMACLIACIVTSGFAVSIAAEDNTNQAGANGEPSLEELVAEQLEIQKMLPPFIAHPELDKPKPQQPADGIPLPLPDEPKPTPAPQAAPQVVSPASIPVARSVVVRQILDQNMGVIERKQNRIFDAVKARKINQEQGRVLLEAIDRLAELGPKIKKARRKRLRMQTSVQLDRFIYAEKKSTQAAGSRTIPSKSISAAFAADAFGESRGTGTVGGAPGATRFFTRRDRMDNVRPLIRIAGSLGSYVVPPPPANKKEKDGYLAKGVKILIDDAMLAEVLGKQDTSDTLAEMEELEDALLAARDAEDALRIVQKYTEAKKTAFLESARKFRNMGDVRLVSLKALVSKLEPYRERWGDRPAELRTVGGLTRIHGFFWDKAQEDLLLVGRAKPGDPPILVDSLIVGRRCVWRDRETPVCSLDAKIQKVAGPQYCYVDGVPKDSEFAEIMLKADYMMKLILLKVKNHELGIDGFNPLEKTSEASEAQNSRFWLFPVQPTEREYHVGPGGSSVLFDSQVQVLTEAMTVGERGLAGTGRTWPADEHDASKFTEYYDEIAEKKPIFRNLRGVFDVVTLGKTLHVLRMVGKGLAPEGVGLLNKLVALPYERVVIPRSFPGVTVMHRIGGREWTFFGGCDIRKRVAARTLVEARSRSLAPLANAAGTAAKKGALFHNVAGRPLRLPEPTGETGAPTERAYAHGIRLLVTGKFAEACEQLTKVIAADPTFATAYSVRAIARFKLGERRQAIWDAAAAISLDPREISYRTTYRQLLIEAGIPSALRGVEDATRKELANIYVRRGIIEHNSGDRKGAMASFTKALGINPKNIRALMRRGLAKARKDDYRGAIADFSAVVRIDPQHMFAYYFRGWAKFYLKDYAGAIQGITEALKVDPQYMLAYWFRARAKMELKEYKAAVADWTDVLRLDPGDMYAYFARGEAKLYLRDYAGAIKGFTEALKADRKYAAACAALAPGETIVNRERLKSGGAHAYTMRAHAKGAVKDYTGAIADATEAITRNPPHVYESYYIRAGARAFLAMKMTRDAALRSLRVAEADLKKVIDLSNEQSPHQANARRLLLNVRSEIIKRQRSR